MLPFYKRFTLFFLVLSLLTVVGIYIIHLRSILDYHNLMVDDSYIYLRFVRNITQGFGFVWNRGEAPVEGFTSFLYLILLVLAEKLGLSLISFMPILGVGTSLFVLVLTWYLGESLNPGHRLENLLAIILVGLSPIFLHWSATGMEMPFYTALLVISTLSYLSYKNQKVPAWLVGFLFAITTLSRPESLMLFGVTLVFDGFTRLISGKKPFSQDTLFMSMAFMLVYLPVFIGKWVYFGYPFPNTYYAKTGAVNWVQVVGRPIYLAKGLAYILAGIGVPLLVILTKINRINWDGKFRVGRVYIIAIVLCSWSITVVNGGDHFGYGRFLLPTIPLLFVLVITVGLSGFLDSQTQLNTFKPLFLSMPVLIAVTALFFLQPWSFISPKAAIPPANPDKLEYFEPPVLSFIVMGKTLDTMGSENESVAVVPIGAIGYYSNMKVIDMLGLADPVIAHQPFDPRYTASWRPGHDKGDGLYILGKHPDFIQLIDQLTSQPFPGLNGRAKQYKSIVEIWASPEFHANYRYYPVQTEGGWYYNLYRRVHNFSQQERP